MQENDVTSGGLAHSWGQHTVTGERERKAVFQKKEKFTQLLIKASAGCASAT